MSDLERDPMIKRGIFSRIKDRLLSTIARGGTASDKRPLRRAATEPVQASAPVQAPAPPIPQRAATFGPDTSKALPPLPEMQSQEDLMAEMRQRVQGWAAESVARAAAAPRVHRLGQPGPQALRDVAAANRIAGRVVEAGPDASTIQSNRGAALRALESGSAGMQSAQESRPATRAQAEVNFNRQQALARLEGEVAPITNPRTDLGTSPPSSVRERRATPFPGKADENPPALHELAQAIAQQRAAMQPEPPSVPISRWSASTVSSVSTDRSSIASSRASVSSFASDSPDSNSESPSSRSSVASVSIRDSLLDADSGVAEVARTTNPQDAQERGEFLHDVKNGSARAFQGGAAKRVDLGSKRNFEHPRERSEGR